MTLEGKVALVTGSGKNLGRAVALELARQGAGVAVNARSNRQDVDNVVSEIREIKGKAVGVLADVASRQGVAEMVAQVVAELGPVDILVNTPALRPPQKFLQITDDDWERVLRVTLYGDFYTAQAVLPGMVERKWGRIINFSGVAAYYGGAGMAHFHAAKTGVMGLTRATALEFAPHGITVNTVVPGVFDTERTTEWHMGEGRSIPAPPRGEGPRRLSAIGREGDPAELAAAVAYLVSDKASFITGQSIHINGGDYLS